MDNILTKLPPSLYKDILQELIAKNLNTKDYSVTFKKGTNLGESTGSVVYRVEADNKNVAKVFKVIVKLAHQDLMRRSQLNVRSSFLREILFFEKVYPLFYRFQVQKGINVEKEGFHQVAECYKSIEKEFEETVFMEDLKEKGFQKFDEMTFEHCRLVMETLGKLHAISFAIKDQQPQLIEPFKNIEDNLLGEGCEKGFKIAISMLGIEDEMFNKKYFDLIFDCVDGKKAEPYSVLSHGECWNNNMMFKTENEIPVETRLLDWQLMRYSSPACDLSQILFPTITKTLRDRHYDEFLRLYYDSFSVFLKKLGSDPEILFPFSKLQEQLKTYGKFGLIVAILFPDVTKVKRGEDKAEFKSKIMDIVKDMKRLKYTF